MTLEQIKNDYAVSKNYLNWDDLLINVLDIEILDSQITEVMKIYAMECLKLASSSIDYKIESAVYRYVTGSITNENNLIK